MERKVTTFFQVANLSAIFSVVFILFIVDFILFAPPYCTKNALFHTFLHQERYILPRAPMLFPTIPPDIPVRFAPA